MGITSEIIEINPESFEMIYREKYVDLVRYCLQFVKERETAEEIVQDLFVYVWEKRNDIEIRTSVSSYLYKSIKNKSINYLKSKFARIEFTDESALFNISEFTNPEQQYQARELEQRIDLAMKSLPEKCFDVFYLSRFSPLSNKEIASSLNITEKTVENQITIALKRIRDYLSKQAITLIPFIILLINRISN